MDGFLDKCKGGEPLWLKLFKSISKQSISIQLEHKPSTYSVDISKLIYSIAYTIIPVCKKDDNVFNNLRWELCTYITIDRHVKIAQQCTTSCLIEQKLTWQTKKPTTEI